MLCQISAKVKVSRNLKEHLEKDNTKDKAHKRSKPTHPPTGYSWAKLHH